MQENFRQFLDRLRQTGELVDLHQAVDIRHIATLVDQSDKALLFKNPIVPGVVLMGWEAIAPVFPAWAQRLSVTFYLKHLCPVSLPLNGPLAIFTIVAEPVPPFVAVLGLLCLTMAILAISCFLIRRMEITYTVE